MAMYKWRHFLHRVALRRAWWNCLRHLHYQRGEDASAISWIPMLPLIEPNQWAVKKWYAASRAAQLKGVPV